MSIATLSGRAFSKSAMSGISAMQGGQVRAQKLRTVTSLAAMSSWVKVPPSRVPAEKEVRLPRAAAPSLPAGSFGTAWSSGGLFPAAPGEKRQCQHGCEEQGKRSFHVHKASFLR